MTTRADRLERAAAVRRITAAMRNDEDASAEDMAAAPNYMRRFTTPWWSTAILLAAGVWLFWPPVRFLFVADALTSKNVFAGVLGFLLLVADVNIVWNQVRRRRWLARHPSAAAFREAQRNS